MEENKIVRPVPDEENLYIFVERFYREKFLPYKFKPHTDIKLINKMASEMDSVDSVLSRYKEGCKEKVFCVRGCGSQFINKEACTRHESVCTYVAVISETETVISWETSEILCKVQVGINMYMSRIEIYISDTRILTNLKSYQINEIEERGFVNSPSWIVAADFH